MKLKKIVIGLIEKVDFPSFGFNSVKAKTDTGAYTSSIHYETISTDGKILEVELLISGTRKKFTFKKFRKVTIKSSNGISEERYLVKICIKIGKFKTKTEFTLSKRSEMKYPVLLGRKLLRGKFIVDVDKKRTIS